MSVIYHRPDFQEDLKGTEKLQEVKNRQNRKTSNYLKVALAICLIPFLLPLTGIIKSTPTYVYYFTFGGAFLLAFSAILRQGNILSRHLQKCERCDARLRKEVQDSCEFYVCHKCNTFIRGDRWN